MVQPQVLRDARKIRLWSTKKAALVATFNLMEKYFTLTRDYGIITDNPYHVAQIVEVFNADWEHRDWDCSAL